MRAEVIFALSIMVGWRLGKIIYAVTHDTSGELDRVPPIR